MVQVTLVIQDIEVHKVVHELVLQEIEVNKDLQVLLEDFKDHKVVQVEVD